MFRWQKITGFLTVSDIVLIVTLLIAGFLSLALVGRIGDQGSYALVEVGGTVTHKFRLNELNEKRDVVIIGTMGEMVLHIEKGKIGVIKSTCPHKLCIRMSPRYRAGESIICVPNKVVITIVGGEKGGMMP